MRTEQPVPAPAAVNLADYRPPAFLVDAAHLTFALDPHATRVKARLEVRRNPAREPGLPLVLDGVRLKPISVALNGETLGENAAVIGPETLTIADAPDAFVLETEVEIDPKNNKALEGLYMSSGRWCTQCEAEGFRKITFWPDRPDVLEAEHTLKAYNADIGAARAAFFPSISLTATAGTASLYLNKLFAPGTGTFSIAPSISLPIFDWGSRRGALALSRAQAQGALASYEKAIQSAFRDVADALAQRGTVDALIGSQERLTEAASVSLKLSQARYTAGADTYLNTLDAQRTLYSAQQTLVSARATRALNIVELYRALGGGADAGAPQS